MKQRFLGKTDIRVSEISLGCWTLGGLNWVDGVPNGWANVDEQEIEHAVRSALDAGVTHFDNADVYGNGRAERMLARVLNRIGVKSTDLILASKVGHFPGTAEHAYHPAHIRHQCEQSLINLNRDYLDLYYLHHGDFGEGDRWLQPAAETMQQLQQEGKIRLIGQSAYSEEDFAKTIPVVKPAVLQSWAHIMAPNFILPGSTVDRLMEEYGLSFIAFSPLNQGILLDKFDPDNPPAFEQGDNRRHAPKFKTEALQGVRPKLQELKARFGDSTEDLAAVALQYVLHHPRVACVIPGFRNEQQVRCNLGAANRPLSEEDIDFIHRLFGHTPG